MRGWIVYLAVPVLFLGGCQRGDLREPEYRTVAQDPNRDTETARRENGRAFALIEAGNLNEAEKVLKKALEADLFHGPAHNNLGVVYQRQKMYYKAAWEFQYATKLMPFSPEPRNNLGLVYERVGRLKEAESWYDQAISLQPDNPEMIGNLVRVRLREGIRDEKTYRLLEELALKTIRPEWAEWAREQLAVMQEPEETAVEIPSKVKPESGGMKEQTRSHPSPEPGVSGTKREEVDKQDGMEQP